MPSSEKHPSRIPMWKGVKASYIVIAMCLFPLAISGFWAYGNLVSFGSGIYHFSGNITNFNDVNNYFFCLCFCNYKIPSNGMLVALLMFHATDLAKSMQGLVSLLVIINSLTSFQIYGMPIFDEMESMFVIRFKKPCPWWLRVIMRALFGFISFFFAVAFPFMGAVAGLVGGIALPVTLAYPCFMWLRVKKPKPYSLSWCLNWGLGVLGMVLSLMVVIGGLYTVFSTGIKVQFFKPQLM
ncbi:putative amino acid transporter, transmembrane domain-containing protein [Helianthus annuus]|nr:putative amino acid transporter, transmembrane domain-containing protein [Helianthus annuus]KAJ0827156.1 putative amino acid transporter, transmembrane domain-containing protein [Helianthus annuus]